MDTLSAFYADCPLISRYVHMKRLRLMPLAIVVKAAEILDVPARLLMCREW